MSNQKHKAIFNIDGKECPGEIFLADGHKLTATTSDLLSHNKNIPEITCTVGNKHYLLIDNFINWWQLSPKYVVENLIENEFSAFEFSLEGVYKWFHSNNKNVEEIFYTILTVNSIKCECRCTKVNQDISLKIKTLSEKIDLDKIFDIISQFIRFFTFICYKKISYRDLYIIDKNKKHHVYSILYSNDIENIDFTQTILTPSMFSNEISWNTVLTNFLDSRKKLFEDHLNNFVGQINYKGYWEFQFLGLMAIVDRYTKVKYEKDHEYVFKKRDINKVLSLFNDFIKKTEKLNSEEEKIKETLAKKIKGLRKWEKKDLFSRINRLINSELFISEGDPLFKFNEEEIKRIVKIRDDIAHGESVKFEGFDYSFISQKNCQLRLIIISLIYKELGISETTILKGIRHSHHHDVLNAEINEYLLNILIGDVPVFNSNGKSPISIINPCFVYNTTDNTLIYDELLTKDANRAQSVKHHKTISQAVTAIAPQYKKPTYLQSIIIKGNKCTVLHGVVIVNYENMPESLQAKCRNQILNFPLPKQP